MVYRRAREREPERGLHIYIYIVRVSELVREKGLYERTGE